MNLINFNNNNKFNAYFYLNKILNKIYINDLTISNSHNPPPSPSYPILKHTI